MRLPTHIARRRSRLARIRWRGSDRALDKLRADLAAAGEALHTQEWDDFQRAGNYGYDRRNI